MTSRNIVQAAFDDFGKSAGMTRRSGSWFLETDEIVSVTNLQKSQYGPSYYVNQGWWIKGAEEGEPRPENCHVAARLEHLVETDRHQIERLFDLDVAIADGDRRRRLLEILNEELLPVTRRAKDIDGLRQLHDEGLLRYAGLRAPTLERLG